MGYNPMHIIFMKISFIIDFHQDIVTQNVLFDLSKIDARAGMHLKRNIGFIV